MAEGELSTVFNRRHVLYIVWTFIRILFSGNTHYIFSSSTHISFFNMTSKNSYRIASIPGDGIGPEVVSATIQVIEKLAKTLGTFNIDFEHIPWGTEYYKQTGRYVSEGYLDTLRQYDAILFGSVGSPGMYSILYSIMPTTRQVNSNINNNRCPRSHLTLGSSPRPARPTPTIRQRPTSPHLPRNQMPPQHSNQRHRLDARTRELRR